MKTLKAHFDGKVLVPDEPLDLPANCPLKVSIEPLAPLGRIKKTLSKLSDLAKQFPVSPDTPADLGAQHDHYLYGLPKRP